MLGSGRPFIVELINPHVNKLSPESFAEMEKEINANPKVLRVEQLKKVSK
jgi:tRNA U54 and U55 pseudouridine synthase Pus10